MNNDFIKELGYKALDSRFKRISDRMSYGIRKLYKEMNLDIEPHWYLVLMLLQKKEECSISDIAECLGHSHPSVVIIVKKMSSKGYLETRQDQSDKRKQMISLSGKAQALIPKLQLIWESCESVILDLLDQDLGIINYLDNIDSKLKETSFHYRFKQQYLKSIQQ